MAVYTPASGLKVDNVTIKANTSGQIYVNTDNTTLKSSGSAVVANIDTTTLYYNGSHVAVQLNDTSILATASGISAIIGEFIFG
jgi:hypothetical protein